MRVEFLGTGGYYPNDRRHTLCVMLPELGLVFDAGTAAFRIPEKLATRELDLFLSHAHLDHVAGLTCLLVPLLNGKLDAVRLHGTEKTLAAIVNHLLVEPLFPIKPEFEYVELQTEVAVADGGVVRHTPLVHPGGSVGYRIDWPNRSLAYITDTTVDNSYLEFIRGVDLLIHECYYPDEMAEWTVKTGHSNTTPVARLARDAGVGRLVLVHVDPLRADDDPIGLETARAVFPQTELAEDLTTVEF